MNKSTSQGQIHHSLRSFLLLATRWLYFTLLARELWWKNQEFFRLHSTHGPPCSYVTCGMNSKPVGGRSSETRSHPIDMMMIIKC